MFYCLFGLNISYSKSPIIGNNYFLHALHKGYYFKLDVQLYNLYSMLLIFFLKGGKILNITIPYKTLVFNIFNYCSKYVLKYKSVNNILLFNNIILGFSTDNLGFFKNYFLLFPYVYGKLLLFGSGGVVLSIFHNLFFLRHKTGIFIINRNIKTLFNFFLYYFLSISIYVIDKNLLFNCNIFLISFIPSIILFKIINYINFNYTFLNIFDISYNKELNFILLFYINGINMLLFQAIENFKLNILYNKLNYSL